MNDFAVKVPLSERINFRVLLVAAIVVGIVGFIMYTYVHSELSHGVTDAGNGMKNVDLKWMSSFPFDQISGTIDDVPPDFRALDGKKVVTYGEMWAPRAATPRIGQFQLVYSIQKCCFSGPPQIQHFVDARAVKEPVPYLDGLVKVTGILHVNVKKAEGKVASVYQLDVLNVEQ